MKPEGNVMHTARVQAVGISTCGSLFDQIPYNILELGAVWETVAADIVST